MKPDIAYLAEAITNLAPGITIEINGDTYAGVVRHAGPALPTEAEVMAEISRIKAASDIEFYRERAVAGGIAWQAADGTTHLVQTDKESRDNLTATAAAIGAGVPLPAGFVWRMADNAMVALDADGVRALATAVIGHFNACYAISWMKKAAPSGDAATGWPDNLGLS